MHDQCPVTAFETEQLDVALNAARMATWALDLASNPLVTSDICRSDYGWRSSEPFTYDDMLHLIHPDDRERSSTKVAEAFAARQDLEIEYRVIRPDGDTVWILVRGRGEYGADGAPPERWASLSTSPRASAPRRDKSR